MCFTLLKWRNLRIPAIVLFMKIFKQKTHNMHKVPLNRTLVHKNTLNSFIEHRLLCTELVLSRTIKTFKAKCFLFLSACNKSTKLRFLESLLANIFFYCTILLPWYYIHTYVWILVTKFGETGLENKHGSQGL